MIISHMGGMKEVIKCRRGFMVKRSYRLIVMTGDYFLVSFLLEYHLLHLFFLVSHFDLESCLASFSYPFRIIPAKSQTGLERVL